MPSLRVGVIFGGRSGEHEVSLASAASVIAALERADTPSCPSASRATGAGSSAAIRCGALAAEARVALPSGDATGAVKKALADRAEAR